MFFNVFQCREGEGGGGNSLQDYLLNGSMNSREGEGGNSLQDYLLNGSMNSREVVLTTGLSNYSTQWYI